MKSVACFVSQHCFLFDLMDFGLIDRRDERSTEGEVGKAKAFTSLEEEMSSCGITLESLAFFFLKQQDFDQKYTTNNCLGD